MDEENRRMTEPGAPPTSSQVAEWLGGDACLFWTRIIRFIEENYTGVFSPEWLFGGKKHGWALRYKKGKSFCTLIPERNRCAMLIVFGGEERAKIEAVRHELSARTLKTYDEATTYHDGKWLLLTVNGEDVFADVGILLGAKRKKKVLTH